MRAITIFLLTGLLFPAVMMALAVLMVMVPIGLSAIIAHAIFCKDGIPGMDEIAGPDF